MEPTASIPTHNCVGEQHLTWQEDERRKLAKELFLSWMTDAPMERRIVAELAQDAVTAAEALQKALNRAQ